MLDKIFACILYNPFHILECTIAKAMFTYSPFDYNLFLTNTTERKAGAFGQKT